MVVMICRQWFGCSGVINFVWCMVVIKLNVCLICMVQFRIGKWCLVVRLLRVCCIIDCMCLLIVLILGFLLNCLVRLIGFNICMMILVGSGRLGGIVVENLNGKLNEIGRMLLWSSCLSFSCWVSQVLWDRQSWFFWLLMDIVGMMGMLVLMVVLMYFLWLLKLIMFFVKVGWYVLQLLLGKMIIIFLDCNVLVVFFWVV